MNHRIEFTCGVKALGIRPTTRIALTPTMLTALALFFMAPAASASDAETNPLAEVGWQAFNLVVLLAVLYFAARKPIAAFFGDRRSQIQTNLDESARLLAEAESRNSALQRRLVDLGSEIEEIRELTRRRAEDESERILAEAGKTAERIRSDATAAIDQELRRAQQELREEAAHLVLDSATEILRDQIAEGDRERLMDEFITRVEPTS